MITSRSQRQIFSVVALILLASLMALYWPVMHADFAWDELLDSLTSISARSADQWQPLLVGQTNGFATYFRPLVMALFSLEMHVFAFKPGPMHAVSLVIHAVNVVLVGLLAMRLSEVISGRLCWRVTVLPMLIYSVHPLLIEPVSWIGCQYDLAMTTFTLLALLLNITFKKPWARAATVSLCFFLAACCKESAVSFPLVLLAFDWLLIGSTGGIFGMKRLRELFRSNAIVYLGVLIAGATYLVARHHYLGHLIKATEGHTLGALGRFQEVSYLLVHYLRMMVWPMTGLSPIHPVAADQFRSLDVASIATDFVSLALASAAVVLMLRRQALGTLLLVVMFSLLPVLHIVPVKFDASLYHERYAMTALALACCLFPLIIRQWSPFMQRRPLLKVAAFGALCLWVFASLANVRATVPLWSSDLMRWQWAYIEYPASEQAQESLLIAYIDHQAYGAARTMVDELLTRQSPCLICVVHAANEAVATHQSALADMLLDRVDSSGLRRDHDVATSYLDTRKRIATNEGDSLSLRNSFDIPHDGHFSGKERMPYVAKGQASFEPPVATAGSSQSLLLLARAHRFSYDAPYPHTVFAASFPHVISASVMAL